MEKSDIYRKPTSILQNILKRIEWITVSVSRILIWIFGGEKVVLLIQLTLISNQDPVSRTNVELPSKNQITNKSAPLFLYGWCTISCKQVLEKAFLPNLNYFSVTLYFIVSRWPLWALTHIHALLLALCKAAAAMRFWDLPNKMLELLKLDSSVKERRGTRSFSITAKTFPKLYVNEKLGSVSSNSDDVISWTNSKLWSKLALMWHDLYILMWWLLGIYFLMRNEPNWGFLSR